MLPMPLKGCVSGTAYFQESLLLEIIETRGLVGGCEIELFQDGPFHSAMCKLDFIGHCPSG